MNALFELSDLGQSYWLDNLSREMIRSGELRRRVEEQGLRGVTSNPAIFHKAISGGDQYDEEIARLVAAGASIPDIYEQLVVSDISEACDALRPVFEDTEGLDGYVSLEVSPRLIHDTARSVEEGRRLWSAVGRPNLMIKIPGTPAGIPAIEELLFEGINVNVTLLFDVSAYDQVARAYMRALTRRVEAGQSPVVASVASFFLSRIDVLVDGLIGHRIDAEPGPAGPAALLGHAGIASAKLAYRSFQQHFSGPSWSELAESGARVQRLLWASTSSKNPLYDAVRYVEPLIGRDTVNTMPESTIEAFSLSGCAIPDTIEAGVDDAAGVFERLDTAGIDMVAVARQLVDEGAEKFIAPFDALLAGLATKRSELAGDADRFVLSSAARDAMSHSLLYALAESRFVRRLFAADSSLWSRDGDVQTAIEARLGWLDSPRNSLDQLSGFEDLAKQLVEEGMEHVVVLGMGGSGLGAAVAADTLAPVEGHPQLVVLDDIDPGVVRDLESRIAIDRTLFVVASKSGTTVETLALYRHFHGRVTEAGVENPGSRFVALTDAGSPLSREAAEAGFRTVIETPANVGGRFSVLAPFGVVPMALAGLDASGVLAAALRQRAASTPEVPIAANPSIGLGVALGALAGAGRTKVTFSTSPSVQRLEDWLEQLIAESTGKDGQGIIPIIGEPARPTSDYEPDRVFVRIVVDGEPQPEVDARLALLESAGHPVIRLGLPDKTAIGAEFYRWELAVASAASLLGVNPFDEPDVADAKRRALQQLAERGGQAAVDADPVAADGGLELFVPGESELAGNGVGDRIRRWIDETSAGDYVAILAYFGASEPRNQLASRLRDIVGQRTGAATTFGYGPRYLHSTGQLHKGGLPGGSFLVLTADEPEDIAVPGEPYGLAQLRLAQATGDAEALCDRGRRVVRINLGWFVDEALQTLSQVLAKPDSPAGE